MVNQVNAKNRDPVWLDRGRSKGLKNSGSYRAWWVNDR